MNRRPMQIGEGQQVSQPYEQHTASAAGHTTPPGTPAAGTSSHPIRVVRADAADLDTLSQIIAEAFHELPPSRWLVPDPATRREIFPPYFRLFVEHTLACGIVHTNPDGTAAALWLPASNHPLAPPDGYHEKLRALTTPWTDRFLALDAALDQHHPAGIAHHHLTMIAVRPGRQGQGVGTRLLDVHHATLDAARLPAYLEAVDLRTRGVYLRCGYADHGGPIRLPDGTRMYPMMREPRADRQ